MPRENLDDYRRQPFYLPGGDPALLAAEIAARRADQQSYKYFREIPR